MGTEYIDGIDFYRLFSSGAKEVIKNRDELNKINVFPVADGDTGINLAVTLNSAMEFTQVNHSFSETSSSMADAIISGARGNSGIIFAQYILGIAQGAQGKERIHFKEFIDISKNSSNELYKVISNPVEGTILTVIKIWTDYLRTNIDKFKSFEDMFATSMDIAKVALNNTTNQLEILKQYNLVDSGGNGFVYFLEGMKNQILKMQDGDKGSIDLDSRLVNIDKYFSDNKYDHIEYKNIEKNRYCCECMISGMKQSCEALKNELEDLGDSIICVENTSRCHIHIHSSKPEMVFEMISKFGSVKMPKIEDMQIQRDLFEKKERIAVVTDSIADIPASLLDKYRIHVIPLNIQIGESTFIDGLGISKDKVYMEMKNNQLYPSSSMPNDAQIMEKFEFLKNHYESIIAITVSSKLSGVYDAFRKAADKLKNQNYNIKIIDSRLNSAAQGLLVIKTAELVEQGRDFETVIDAAKALSEKIEIYVALNTIKNAYKSGRIPRKLANIGSWIKLKAMISLDSKGNGTAPFLAMSRDSLIDKICKIVKFKVENKELSEYAISYSKDFKKAVEFAEMAENIIGKPPLYICEISSVTILHVGQDAVAISIVN